MYLQIFGTPCYFSLYESFFKPFLKIFLDFKIYPLSSHIYILLLSKQSTKWVKYLWKTVPWWASCVRCMSAGWVRSATACCRWRRSRRCLPVEPSPATSWARTPQNTGTACPLLAGTHAHGCSEREILYTSCTCITHFWVLYSMNSKTRCIYVTVTRPINKYKSMDICTIWSAKM